MSNDDTAIIAARENSEPRTSLLYSIGRVICRISTTLLFDLKVSGTEHIPHHGGVLLLSNHQSYLDPVLLGVHLRRPLSFLAKSELFKSPVFGRLISGLNAFPIQQGTGDIGAVRETIARLQQGHMLTIFPEGSRSPDGHLRPLQSGFALIVRKTEVPIIPAAIHGAFLALPRGAKGLRAVPIHVRFGPALHLSGLRSADIVAKANAAMHELFDGLRREVESQSEESR